MKSCTAPPRPRATSSASGPIGRGAGQQEGGAELALQTRATSRQRPVAHCLTGRPPLGVQADQGAGPAESRCGEDLAGALAVGGGERARRVAPAPSAAGPAAAATARRFCSTQDTVSSRGTTRVSSQRAARVRIAHALARAVSAISQAARTSP